MIRFKSSHLTIVFLVGFMFCLPFSAPLYGQDISSGLEGHWTFDEGGGTIAANSSGQGRDAEFSSGEPVWAPGQKGTALQFDGEADSLSVPDWYGIAGNSPRTITCWIKSTADNTHGIVSWGLSDGNGRKYHFRINNDGGNGILGAVRTEIQGTFNIGTTIVNDDAWHFIASVFPEGGQYMIDVMHYVDGRLEEMSGTNPNGSVYLLDTAASAEESDQLFRIGSRIQSGTDHFYPGLIDEVRVYSRGLSAEEIQAIFESEGGSSSGLSNYMLYK